MKNNIRFSFIQPSGLWHIQRITGLFMLPLWLSLHSTILSFLITLLPFHIHMGLQEIVEDYIYNDTAKSIAMWLLRIWVLMTINVFITFFI